MVESLKELNEKCQKPRYKEVGNWMVRHVLRDAALPVTWLLLHTNITANQVTLVSLVVGVLGIALFAVPSANFFFLGVILLQTWYFLDHVDGQIARYRQTASITGRFFDFLTHHIIHGVIFFSLGLYLSVITQHLFFVVWGFMLSIFMMSFNLIHDAKSKAFIERLLLHRSVTIQRTDSDPDATNAESQSTPRKIFSWIHKACEIHVLMNVLTICALVSVLAQGIELRGFLFLIYSVLVPVLSVTKITHVITQGKADQEFRSRFILHEQEPSQQ